MSSEVEHENGVLDLVITRPEVHNALDQELVARLTEQLERARTDPAVRVVTIRGAGDEAFCSGADLALMVELDQEALGRFLAATRKLFRAIVEMPQPTVAIVNGHAHGGGAEIACACDLRLGCERTTFRFPGVTYGLAVGSWHLPSIIGLPRAKELLMTGRLVDASEAEQLGLLNRTVPSERLFGEASALTAEIASHPQDAVRSIKALLNRTEGAPLLQRFYRELYSNRDRGANRTVQSLMRRFIERNAE